MKSITKNVLKKLLPKRFRLAMQYIVYLPLDIVFLLLGRKDQLVPPIRLIGLKDFLTFKKNGNEYFEYYIKLCKLKPNEKILDVGCGIGRKTVPLTSYLDKTGSYEGFDTIQSDIDWCKKRISTRYPNFHFQWVNIFNKSYNPQGKYKASEFKFPFENDFFDIVTLGSVFTHMLPKDLENYLSEISRVLKKGGRCLISYFLLNDESLKLVKAQKTSQNFEYECGSYRTTTPDTPEDSIGYDEQYILNLYNKFNLKIKEPIHYGCWCERKDFLSYQDIVVATKI